MIVLPPRFAVSAADITRVVSRFYAVVRGHPKLGPIFAAHVTDWHRHEVKIVSFWRNAILYERGYGANPMQVHMAAGNIRPAHFAVWLACFDQVLEQELPAQTAHAWAMLAHRIGRGLSYGLATTGPPKLDMP